MEDEQPPRPVRITAAEADALIEEQRSSGLSVAAFAKSRGIPAWSIYNARNRARKKASAQFAEVVVTSTPQGPRPTSSSLELILPSGLTLRVPPDFDEVCLRRILGVLAAC